MDPISLAIVCGAIACIAALIVVQVARRRARQRRDEAIVARKAERGEAIPRSLHPVIDTDVCIGSLSCLKSCPEGDILGVVNGAARLVHAENCIGHGRCAAECPVGAIKLVFGTAQRGVDIPEIDQFFESSRPGIHVVGELGGMGLIRNAITQGLEAAERLADVLGAGAGQVVVVGAGPSGLATALGLRARGVPFRLLEQGTVGGSIAHYPRRKVVMTERVELPLAGKFGKPRISKEELLDTWDRILKKTAIRVEEGVRVTGIRGEDGRFAVETDHGLIEGAKVVLAIGRRGTPRKLDVPGEHLAKVFYGLREPDQFDGAKVLVVGGGDSALEAAIQLVEESTARVTLSYRGAELARCREANRARVAALAREGRLRTRLPSEVREIRVREVLLESAGKLEALDNDFVIVNVGGELPSEFLAKAGVGMRRFHGEAPGAHGHAHDLPIAGRVAAERRRKIVRRLALAAAGVAVLAVLAWQGREYYPLPRPERLRSALHASMKPAGPWGHGVGIAATLVMLSNFLYALRKRWKRLRALGGIGSWLDFHVFVGFMSPLVIAFHAAFQSNNLLATGTAGALGVVVGTGIVGRFIYGLVPSSGGKALELADLLARYERAREEIEGRHAVGRVARARLARLRFQIRFYSGLKRLLRIWRIFHASLAIFLVLAIAAHIGLSLYLGYGLLR
jgi:thioredoxin reductase/Pyruvate/2-oxoacid:ferredoxin oxidoreductase delta subunit